MCGPATRLLKPTVGQCQPTGSPNGFEVFDLTSFTSSRPKRRDGELCADIPPTPPLNPDATPVASEGNISALVLDRRLRRGWRHGVLFASARCVGECVFPRKFSCFTYFYGYDVKKVFLNRALLGVSMLAALALVGCGTPPAKDFGGSWKPVNRFQTQPTEIPLAQPYEFYASPMDGTLKNMLTRWSKDSGMVLTYQLREDYTLYTPVSQIRTSNIKGAAAELSSIYSTEGVSVSVNDRQILVQPASMSNPAPTAVPAPVTSPSTPSGASPSASTNPKQ